MRLEKKWLALLGTSPGVFMSTVDSSIVNISLPTLARAFEVDLPSVRWVMMGYLLTISGLLLAAGRLADLAGRKRVFLHGLRLFTLSSFLCALAGGVGWLVSFRVLQGVGASMIMAVSPAIVVAAFPPSERGTGLGVASMVVGVGLSLGPTLGGFLTAYLGWRSIFFVNVPVGILGILLASRVLDRDEPAGEGSLDLLGAALLALGIVPLVWGLSQEQQAGWTSAPVAGAIALGALALAAFAWAELRAEGPILELRLFAEPLFGASTVGIFLGFVSLSSVTILMPFYMEAVLGFRADLSGRVMTVVPLVMLVSFPVSGWLTDRLGSRLMGSLGFLALASALLLLGRLGAEATAWGVALHLAALGLAMGLWNPPNKVSLFGSVPPRRIGMAAGMLALMRNLGMVCGVALSTSLFWARLHALGGRGASSFAAVTDPAEGTLFVRAMGQTLTIISAAGLLAFLLVQWGHGRRPKGERERLAVGTPPRGVDFG